MNGLSLARVSHNGIDLMLQFSIFSSDVVSLLRNRESVSIQKGVAAFCPD